MKISKKVFFLLVAASIACSCQIFAGRRRGKAPPHRRSKTPHRRFGGRLQPKKKIVLNPQILEKIRDKKLFDDIWTVKMGDDLTEVKGKGAWNAIANVANRTAVSLHEAPQKTSDLLKKHQELSREVSVLEGKLRERIKKKIKLEAFWVGSGPKRRRQITRRMRKKDKKLADAKKRLDAARLQHTKSTQLRNQYFNQLSQLQKIYEKDTKKK
jgi:hypothetical protein